MFHRTWRLNIADLTYWRVASVLDQSWIIATGPFRLIILMLLSIDPQPQPCRAMQSRTWELGWWRARCRLYATAGCPWRNPPVEEQIERCLSSERTTRIASHAEAAAGSSAEFNYLSTYVAWTTADARFRLSQLAKLAIHFFSRPMSIRRSTCCSIRAI